MKKYIRNAFEVEAIAYETGKGMEDGFELYTRIITNGWICHDNLIQHIRPDGTVVCPFIQNRRGIIFIRQGDYIITETDKERHVCGADKFSLRYKAAEE